jgi:hypothetical protein
LLIEAAEKGSGHAEGGGGEGEPAKKEAKACVDAEVEDLVIGQREKVVHPFDSARGQGGDAEDEKKVKDGGK